MDAEQSQPDGDMLATDTAHASERRTGSVQTDHRDSQPANLEELCIADGEPALIVEAAREQLMSMAVSTQLGASRSRISNEKNRKRFETIARGKAREELRKRIQSGQSTGNADGSGAVVPVPILRNPRFRLNPDEGKGQGSGEGDGDGDGPGQPGRPGDKQGDMVVGVEFTPEDLGRILGEELELPRLEPKSKNKLEQVRWRFNKISRNGPDSLLHRKRTMREAIKEAVARGEIDPDGDPDEWNVLVEKHHKRFRSLEPHPDLMANAAVIYVMDVSGSMGEQQRQWAKTLCFWITSWVRANFKNVDERFVRHDAVAEEVDRETFFGLGSSGGTKISSAYEEIERMIDNEFPPERWNIYVIQISDGDNWSGNDNARCAELLEKKILPSVNSFNYAQTKSDYGSGRFFDVLGEEFGGDERLERARIEEDAEIVEAIKTFFGKKKS